MMNEHGKSDKPFTLTLTHMKSLELTALYTLPQGLARHSESPHGVHDGYVVWRCIVHEQIT